MSRTLTTFRPQEIAVAVAVTCVLEGSLVGALWLRSRVPTPAGSSPVVLTEVPVLIEPARGFGIGPMPKPAPRPPSPARDVAPSTPARTSTADAPPSDTSPRTAPDAGRTEGTDAALAGAASGSASAAASATSDAPSGSAAASSATSATTSTTSGGSGGDGDPLAAQQAGVYRGQLDGWFSARFAIRGKVPFDELKTLRAVVVVDVTGERHVSGFRITKPSGNAVFDAELTRALSQIQNSGAELPAPPEERKELLGSQVTLSFSCTSRARCE